MEVKRTDYSLLAKMGFLSEVFRQDVREATRTICENAHQLKQVQSDCEDGTCVGRVPTGRQRSDETRLQSDCEDGTFVGRVPTGCQASSWMSSGAGGLG